MQVAGNADQISNMVSALQKSVKSWSTWNLTTAAQLQAIKKIESQHKCLRQYTITIHGLMTLLHKYNGKAPREKAAMNRERLGGSYYTLNSQDACSSFWRRVYRA